MVMKLIYQTKTFFRDHPRLLNGLVVLAFLLYGIQSVYFAYTLDVTMDEGTYLMKGVLFWRGDYTPFQDYGPWMNKMPLAFLVPGAAQMIFAPGLLTGRMLSVCLNVWMLLGLWSVTRRLAGKGWAALVVWVLALNSGGIAVYSTATSQVQVAALLAWSLAAGLGKDRKLWQILIGAALACLVVLIRQNMLPLIPIFILYAFWQQGKKPGWLSLLVSVVIFGGFHLYYWPNIMRIWAPWMPAGLTRLILGEEFLIGAVSQNVHPVDFGFWTRAYAFFESYRIHTFLLVGLLIAAVYWPKRSHWKDDARYKDAVFLGVFFGITWAAHLWASVLQDACVFCYSGYISFFSPAGLLFVTLVFDSVPRKAPRWKEALGWLAMAFVFAGFGYAGYRDLFHWVPHLQVPRMRNLRFLPGTLELWRLLSNKYNWSFDLLERLLPALWMLGIGLIVLGLSAVIYHVYRKKTGESSLTWLFSVLSLILLVILSIFPIPGGGRNQVVCGENVIASHEQVGRYLAERVEPGSLVYWENDVSPLPLLSIPGVRIFPAQLDHDFNRMEGGNTDLLHRYGYWNDELARQWSQQADYLLVADRILGALEDNGQITAEFRQIGITPKVANCRPNSSIHIFARVDRP